MSDFVQDTPAPVPVGKAVSILGGLVSIGLIIGIGIWSYDLIKRDVSGVPVVRALDGPFRVQPVDPGGRPADNQGLAVNAVAATGAAAAPADQLTLAPRPTELAEEDLAGESLSQIRPEETRASIEALVQELADGVTPLAPLVEVSPEPVEEVPVSNDVVTQSSNSLLDPIIADTVPGVNRSWRPQARPLQVRASQPVPATPVSPSGVAEVAPDEIEKGTRLAQLGAFDSADEARAGWDRLANKFQDVMGGKVRVIEEASSGGRTFYRLRAHGFADLGDARRFCSVFVSEKADCIPVTAR